MSSDRDIELGRSRHPPPEVMIGILARLGVGYLVRDDGSISCGRCGMTSYNRQDVENRYCGNCHVFHEDRNG